jgi:integration host factor subunit beta
MEDDDPDSAVDSQLESHSITRKTIVKTLAQETQLPQAIVKQLVDKLFDVITDSLVVNQRLELRNFGVFEVKKRAPRLGRNPKTKEEIPIESRYVVTFKPGKAMDQRLQQLMAERNEE